VYMVRVDCYSIPRNRLICQNPRTVAVTPTKSSRSEFAEVKRVCYDCTMAGFKAIYEAGPARPFRFLYFSGAAVMDDPKAKKPFYLGDYMVMRVSIYNV